MTAIEKANEKIRAELQRMGYRPVSGPAPGETRFEYHIRLQDQWIDATEREAQRLLNKRNMAHG